MVLYVAFVAITNVCIGFAVGRMLHSPKRRQDEDEAWDTVISDRGDTESNASVDRTPEADSNVITTDEPYETQSSEDESRRTSRNAHTWLGDKCEFATQLREVTEKATYSRSVRDKTLMRQAADQVLSCISGRYDELQQILGTTGSDERVIGDRLNGVEMLSAQIETSISNLRARLVSIGR